MDQVALRKMEEKGKERQKNNYDQHHSARVKEEFEKNDRVWTKDLRVWGTIEGKADAPRSYNVNTPRGSFRRNSFYLVASFTKEQPEVEMNPELGSSREEANPVIEQPEGVLEIISSQYCSSGRKVRPTHS